MINIADCFIPEFCTTCTIGTTSYRCIQSELSKEQRFTGYGLAEGASLFLDFVISDLPTVPVEGDKITFRSKTYRVVKTDTDSMNQTVKVGLASLSGTK